MNYFTLRRLFTLTGALFLLVLTSTAQELSQEIPLDPKTRFGQLENGITYYIRHNAKPENRVELRLAVQAGSMQEDDDQLGLAHFTEHMLFNGTKNFEKNEIINFLQSIGVEFGADLNAYTSFDETVYMLPLPTDKPEILDQGFQILEDWAHQATFEAEEIDKERGVVVEEWRTGLGANERLRKQWWPLVMKDSRYRDRLPIGDTTILKNFEYDVIKRFYQDWYRPDLMAVIVVGDVDVDEMEAKVKEQFSNIPPATEKRTKASNAVPGHEETLIAVATDKEMPFTQVQLFYKLPKKETTTFKDYRSMIARRLYNQMLNARLSELTEKAAPPFIQASTSYGGFAGDKDSYSSFALVKENGVLDGLSTLLTENQRVLKHGFVDTELKRAKENLLNGYEKAYKERDKTESGRIVGEYVRHFIDEEPVPGIAVEYEFLKEYLSGIILEEINALPQKWITQENRVVVITGSEKEGLEMPTEEEVTKVLDEVEMMEIAPYEDKVIDEPLIAEMPAAGEIVAEQELPGVDATELTLSNGIKVILKSTDFKEDEILLSAYSFGGTSQVSDEKYESASFASPIVQESGLRIFSSRDLQKLLTGKTVNARAYIGDLDEGFSGSASPKDLETLFQLVHLYATEPRKDEEAFQSFMAKNQPIFENLLSSPNYFFQDKVARILAQDHPRANRFPTSEDLEAVKLEEAISVYEDRFADMDDFVFFLVGNFEEEAVKSYIKTYLASLPATDREESFKDVGIRPPSNGMTKTLEKGTEAQSQVRITIPGELKNEKDRFLLSMLSNTLSIKLIENLREEISGVYGTRAQASTFKYPYLGYSMIVGFSCAPENVDTLIEATRIEMEKMLANGPTPEDLDKVKEQERRDLEENLKKNGWWLSTLRSVYYNDRDLENITEAKLLERIEELNVEELKRVANDYLNLDRQITVILNPEEVTETATAAAPEDMSAEQVIDRYIDAIGGKEKLETVTTLKKETKISVMGQELAATEVWKAPNSYGSVQQMPGGNMRMVITKDKAAMITPQGAQELPAEAMTAVQFDKAMFQELVYESMGVSASLEGIEQVEGKDAYKIVYTLPGGTSMSKWYDVESGLSTKMEAQGQEVTFLSYTTVEGIQFAAEGKMSAQGMQLNINTESVEVNGEIDESLFNME